MSSIRRIFLSALRRTRWLQCPTAALLALLQRTPVVRIATYLGDAFSGGGAASTALVRSATALAALGAIDTVAGASTPAVIASSLTPLSATTGVAVPTVAFGLNSTTGLSAESWQLNSELPAGISVQGANGGALVGSPLTGPGIVSGANLILSGTPTVTGTYFLDIVAYEYPGGSGDPSNSPSSAHTADFLFTINVAQGAVTTPVTIVSLPVSQTVAPNTTSVFSVVASSSAALTYQWSANGVNISGATSPRLVVTSPAATGTTTYSVLASNASGGSNSASATLTVTATTTPGHLINESVLTSVPTGGNLTVGFTTTNISQRFLIRGVGPGLSSFLSGYMVDPSIKVFTSASVQTTANDNWGSATTIMTADSAVGAFALTSGSLDAALITSPATTGETVQLTPNTTGGTGLAEIYDYPTGTYVAGTSPRLINLSANFLVAASGNLTAGFVVSGNTAKTFLIRAMGPALQAFGISNTMSDPVLTLYNSSSVVLASNQKWGGDSQIATVAAQVGAFAFPSSSSADSALLVTLPAGSYTAAATSASGVAGQVLVEVYEVP